MANKKKKKKRPYTPPAQASGESTTRSAEKPAAPPAHARGGAAPERRERKDQARQSKEAARRSYRRRALAKRLVIFGVIIALLAGTGYYFVHKRQVQQATIAAELAKASAAAKAAGCDTVKTLPPYQPSGSDGPDITQSDTPNRVHVQTLPPLSQYPSTPPASGPHFQTPHPQGIELEPPEVGNMIHSLEHGAAEIWYAPGAEKTAAYKEISDFLKVGGANEDHTILAPYNYPDEGEAGQLPKGTQMALVAWQHEQTCAQLSLPVVQKFLSEYRFPTYGGGDYKGDAPEEGLAI